MSAVMTCSQILVCISLPIIAYGCSKRKAEGSEKAEQNKKDDAKAALASSSCSEEPRFAFEITAKSDRTEWTSSEDVRKPATKSIESKDGPEPDVKKAPCHVEVKTAKQSQPTPQKTSSNASKVTAKSLPVEKTQEDSLKVQSTAKKPFVLETLSFLNTLVKSTERKGKEGKESVEDETIHDAPSLAKVNISKCSEELETLQMKRTKSKQTSERTPEVKSELTDESKLYPLQKTMGSQRDDSEEKTTGTAEVPLAVDKTPLPSAEPKS